MLTVLHKFVEVLTHSHILIQEGLSHHGPNFHDSYVYIDLTFYHMRTNMK